MFFFFSFELQLYNLSHTLKVSRKGRQNFKVSAKNFKYQSHRKRLIFVIFYELIRIEFYIQFGYENNQSIH